MKKLWNKFLLEYARGEIEAASLSVPGYLYYLATITVTSNANSGANTLRQAIVDANDGDEIVFNLLTESETITLESELSINESLTIDGDNTAGSGADVTISGNDVCRVLHINSPSKTVNISNLTVTGGNSGNDVGGGIKNTGTLAINNCNISGNTAASGYGGGICNTSTGDIDIISSTLSGNSASGCGAILNYGTMEIVSSTISGNTAENYGGGIYTNNDVTIANSTVTGNKCDAKGGGFYIYGGNVIIDSCTIAHNHSGYDGSNDQGGGLYLSNGNLSVKNSLLADNIRGNDVSTTGDDYYYSGGTLNDTGYNIVEYQGGSSTGVNKTFTSTTNFIYSGSGNDWNHDSGTVTGTVSIAEDLADNGGPTQTLALTSSNSIAIGNGNTFATIDQRGATRKSPPCIGAYEYVADYRTDEDSGTSWGAASNWEVSQGFSTWGDAAEYPDDDNYSSISVRRSMNVDTSVSIDKTTVDQGATLSIDNGQTLTVTDGPDTDLTVAGSLANDGALTCNDGSTVVFSGSTHSTLTGAGTWTFKTLTLDKATGTADTKLDINTSSNVTVATALAVTKGTVDLNGWTHDLKIGGSLDIGPNGRWINQGNIAYHLLFYGPACTLSDISTGGPQNLGHIKVAD